MGCQPTHFSLRVRTPDAIDATGTRIRLVIDHEPVCSGGILFAGRPDRDGMLTVHTPACGPARLVVARPGRRRVVQEMDTCEVESLEVVLWPAPPPRVPTDLCGQAVLDFMEAWVNLDHEAARTFWVNPDDYARHALQPSSSKPWATDIADSTREDAVCRVRATESYDFGCELTWQFELEQGGDTWRIRWMEDVVPAEP